MENEHKLYGPYERFFKRPLDLICSITGLVLFWWLYIIIAILVRVKLGSPVLFVQDRPGKDGKIFKMYKFRTMTDQRDAQGNLLPDTQRLTSFGSVLRSSSLDELPELFNIVRGDMSFIGPRPLLVKYLPRYSERQRRRHEVRPGMSGYAQAYGRNAVPWEERFDMDVWYVDHITFWGDVKILFATVSTVLRHRGIGPTEKKDEMMEEFKGTREVVK